MGQLFINDESYGGLPQIDGGLNPASNNPISNKAVSNALANYLQSTELLFNNQINGATNIDTKNYKLFYIYIYTSGYAQGGIHPLSVLQSITSGVSICGFSPQLERVVTLHSASGNQLTISCDYPVGVIVYGLK